MKKITHAGNIAKTRGESAPPSDQANSASITETKVHEIVNGALKRMETQVLPSLLKPIEERQTNFLADLTSKLDSLKPVSSSDGSKNKSDETNTSPGLAPEVSARIHALETQSKRDADKLTKLEEERRKAEERSLKTDKESKIRSVLSGFTFVSPEAADDLFNLLDGAISRTESGELIGGDNLPFDVFIKDYVPAKKAHFLAPAGKGGSGATGGTTRHDNNRVNLEDIKPGMDQASIAKTAAAIRAAISTQ